VALAEYSLVLAFVAAVCVIAVTAIGIVVVGFFTDVLPGFE
jgi:Flp pilus assembly pilin Flp